MTHTQSTDHGAVWEKYVSAWRAEGTTSKQEILKNCADEAVVYTDPLVSTTGLEELIAYMVDFHRQIPGGHFVTTYFLAHDDKSIARWNMVDGAGRVLSDGMSYGEYADGRLTTTTGFFQTPAA